MAIPKYSQFNVLGAIDLFSSVRAIINIIGIKP